MSKHTLSLRISIAVIVAALAGCGIGGGGGGGDEKIESGDCAGGGWCGEQAIAVTANITGAEALFIQSSTGSALSSISPTKAVTVSSESPLFSVTTDGIVGVLAALLPDASDALSELPSLSFVAVSPIGHVILAFEHPFIFTETAADGTGIADYSDPWAASSPFTCQVYVVNKKINDSSLSASDAPGLNCLTTELELNTWDFRSAMVQFDGSGGVYFSAHVPQNWKNVLVKWTPGSDDASTSGVDESVDGALSEVINANICFREFLVTNEGGVLYTGITSTSGDCSGTSFLRYKTPAGALQEITSGWWDYVFKPVESTAFASSNISAFDITTANVGQILFYGPDPELATTPEWDDACLFKFNPDESGTARSVKIADCDIDIHQYVDWADDLATKRSRCTETKSLLGGENRPEKILLADFNGDGSNYEVYIVGNVYEKKQGEWRYDMCVDEGAHCVDADGVPDYTNRDSQANCEAAGGAWKTYNDCYNQLTDSTFYTTMTAGAASADGNWKLNGQWCEQPGGDWRNRYSAFAWVIYDDNGTSDESDDTRQIVRFSDDDEIVRNGWTIGNRLVYSSFNSTDGIYRLRELKWTPSGAGDATVNLAEVSKTNLQAGIEVYELFADPRSNHPGEWFFNGLRFSDNQYITGTFNPGAADPSATLATEAGVTGQIETLVIVPNL